jgi:hypothetical protein
MAGGKLHTHLLIEPENIDNNCLLIRLEVVDVFGACEFR